MSEANGAGTPPAGADLERLEIERIKTLLRGMVRSAERSKSGSFFGAGPSPLQAGKDLLKSIDECVERELAAAAEGGESE
jgi:hypothetical protein